MHWRLINERAALESDVVLIFSPPPPPPRTHTPSAESATGPIEEGPRATARTTTPPSLLREAISERQNNTADHSECRKQGGPPSSSQKWRFTWRQRHGERTGACE